VETLDRVEIMRDLRLGVFDVLVGINLLREGLDLPEVSLVAILDADKEGFLRSERSLTQTAGRAARNVNSKVVLYADKITDSMKRMMEETNRRREKQIRFNTENNITPTQISKSTTDILSQTSIVDNSGTLPGAYIEKEHISVAADPVVQYLSREKLEKLVIKTTRSMEEAVKSMDFLEAARLRDDLSALRKLMETKA
jgi:excinuclease ABC subunit B